MSEDAALAARWIASSTPSPDPDHRRPQPDADALHAQLKPLLAPGGRYLVCDHFLGEGGLVDDQLYMTVAGQWR